MSNIAENRFSRAFVDSLSQTVNVQGDSLVVIPHDTLRETLPSHSVIPDTQQIRREIRNPAPVSSSQNVAVNTSPVTARQAVSATRLSTHQAVQSDSAKMETRQHSQPFRIFHSEESGFAYKPKPIWKESQSILRGNDMIFSLNEYQRTQLNWTLFIGITSVLLLIYLKTYYQKLVAKVMNTLVNFQLADTMLREKNSIVKRAFFIMNLNFILIFSLFILLLLRLYDISYYHQSLKDYFLVVGIISLIILVRLILYYAVAFLFEWLPAVQAQLHNSFLINKNLGLLLLPVVFIAIYTAPLHSKLVIFSGLAVVIIATVFKLIRGFQIIIKNGILLFYAILYLCTLELLPIVLGSKLIILLR